MTMLEWAEKEIEIACKNERGDKPEYEWDYGCACYKSAFEAFKTLCGQGHSGMSIQFAKQILNRLIDGIPLSPIEDTEDVWDVVDYVDEMEKKRFQCKRMSSLFKNIFPDGKITYYDTGRFVVFDIHSKIGYRDNLCYAIIDEKYPVTMPYYPNNMRYELYAEDFLVDKKNGDFDTRGIFYVITPEGETVNINRYFRVPEEGETPTYHGWVEINKKEYIERQERRIEK